MHKVGHMVAEEFRQNGENVSGTQQGYPPTFEKLMLLVTFVHWPAQDVTAPAKQTQPPAKSLQNRRRLKVAPTSAARFPGSWSPEAPGTPRGSA